MTIRLFFLILCWISFSLGYSQEYFVQNFSMKHGLPDNQLHNIIQSQDNTLWFTTYHGLVQYDGKSFKIYTKDDGLVANHILNIFEDSKGRVWVSPWANEGLNYIENGEVVKLKDSVLQTLWVMNAAYEDSKGRIWFFGNHTVIKYEEDEFELVFKSEDEKEYHHPNQVVEINDNSLFVTQMENGVVKVTLEPFSIEHINNESHGINNICYSALKDRNGTFWFGCYGAIYSFKNDVMTTHHLPIDFDKCRVWGISEDHDGYLWLATYGGGVVRWDKKDEFIKINTKNGLSDDYCYSVLIDQENNKWITTDIGGLDKIRDFSFQYYTKNSGLESNHIGGISQLENGDIVIATEKGISIIKNGVVDTTIYKEFAFTSLSKNNEIWYTSHSGYGVLNENYNLSNFDHSNTYNFIDSKSDVIAGLSRVLYNKKEVFYREHFIIPCAFYLGDQLFIGSNYGLIKYENNAVSQLKDLDYSQFSEILTSLKISKTEALVTSPDELVYLKKVKDSISIKRFSSKKLGGLFRIFALFKDGNNLWLGAQNTLAKIDLDELLEEDNLIIEKYDISSGFISGLIAQGAIFKDSEGAIWLGTSEGVAKFSPQLKQKNSLPSFLKLKEVQLFSKKIKTDSFLKNDKVTFAYNQNDLTFHFQAVSLTNPDKIKVKYRLLGLTNTWSTPDINHPISFPFLNPGEYTLEFVASNGEGVWSEKPLQFSFTIEPPFWKKVWFMILIFSIITLSIFFLFYRQKRKAKKRHEIQEKFIHDIIEAQEDERKRISKGLHDGIGQSLLLIKNGLQTKDTDDIEKMVSSTIEEVRSISRNLHPFQLEKLGLTKALESMVEELNNSLEETIFTEEIENIDDIFSKDQEINIYRIIQEIFNNIIKHAKASASRIVIKKYEKQIEIIVLDNGIGFDIEQNREIMNSLGLKSIRERTKFLNGTVIFESKVNKGTTIQINIAYESK